MPWWKTTTIGLYYLTYPLAALASRLLVLLSFLTAPLLHIGHYIGQAVLLPFRLLAKFETLYIFFGVAALVGLLTGLCLHAVSKSVIYLLNLGPKRAGGEEKLGGHTAASYREARRKKREEELQRDLQKTSTRSLSGDLLKREYAEWLEQDRGKQKEGLLGTTILEEEDDTDEVF